MSAVVDTPMFDVDDLCTGSGPRVGRDAPIQSHMAADRSQRTMHATKRAVLELVLQKGELAGSELNALYLLRASRHGWGKVAPDTPRKRAGELAQDGFLSIRTQTSAGNHLPEAVYSITAKGREVLQTEGVLR